MSIFFGFIKVSVAKKWQGNRTILQSVKLGYNDPGYNEYTVIMHKISWSVLYSQYQTVCSNNKCRVLLIDISYSTAPGSPSQQKKLKWDTEPNGAWQKDPKPAELTPAAAGLRRDWGGVNKHFRPAGNRKYSGPKITFLPHLSLLLHPLT